MLRSLTSQTVAASQRGRVCYTNSHVCYKTAASATQTAVSKCTCFQRFNVVELVNRRQPSPNQLHAQLSRCRSFPWCWCWCWCWKLEAGSRKQEAGSRKPEAGSRKLEAAAYFRVRRSSIIYGVCCAAAKVAMRKTAAINLLIGRDDKRSQRTLHPAGGWGESVAARECVAD